MKIKYFVITRINGENNHTPFAYKKDDKIYVNTMYGFNYENIPKEDWLLTKVFANVFQIGELLVIDDEIGREGNWGRAPRKWDIEWREFTDPIKAMRFSNRLIKKIIDEQ